MWFVSCETRLFSLLPLSFNLSLSYVAFSCSVSLPILRPTSPSPAGYLLTLSVCAVNNWWSSTTQRVTGPGENMSPISFFIYKFIYKFNRSEKTNAQVFIQARGSMGMKQPARVRFAVCGSCDTCDHERVNAACLADSRTEGGKGSLNEWEAGGRKEEEWQNDRVN